jgi:hypothetical protein
MCLPVLLDSQKPIRLSKKKMRKRMRMRVKKVKM